MNLKSRIFIFKVMKMWAGHIKIYSQVVAHSNMGPLPLQT